MACEPTWSRAGLPCASGGHLIIVPSASFTWPAHPEPLSYVAAFYSAMPFFAVILVLVALVVHRGLWELVLFMYCPFILEASNIGLKRIFKQPRPPASCLVSCGMPSGHSMESIGLGTYLVLELYRLKPAYWKWKIAALVALLAPVPWSRVELGDHSMQQVLAGSGFGIAFGVTYHCVLVHLLGGNRHATLASSLCLYDDYAAPAADSNSEAEPFVEKRDIATYS
mmetsp:Transcript_86015/g.162044  ORF Transcript_86015/g.162044 Transcript_86015/m.162044 type:complete len:225 (+) Transcript_86015:172-846(+)